MASEEMEFEICNACNKKSFEPGLSLTVLDGKVCQICVQRLMPYIAKRTGLDFYDMIEPELQVAAGKLTAEDISSALLGDKQKQELIADTLLVAAPFKIRDKIPARKAEVRNNTGHACNVCGYLQTKGVLSRDMLLPKDACICHVCIEALAFTSENKSNGKPERFLLTVKRAAKSLNLADYWKILEGGKEQAEAFDKAFDTAAKRKRKVRRRIIIWGIIFGFIASIVFFWYSRRLS